MSLILRALLCASGLVACSRTAAPSAQSPVDVPTQQSNSQQQPLATPPAPESPTAAAESASVPPHVEAQADENNDPGLRERIRQAAVADSLL